MPENTLTSHVLIYGVTADQLSWYRSQLKEAFYSLPNAIELHCAQRLTQALPHIYNHRDLEIVYFPLEWALGAINLDEEVYALWKIAEALRLHKNQPWAIAPSALNTLVHFFKYYGTSSGDGDLDVCILGRWHNVTKRRTREEREPE